MRSTKRQMLIGGIMLGVGWLVVFGQVVGLIPSPIWFSLLMYGVTLWGFMLGMLGAMSHIRLNIQKARAEKEFAEQDEYYDDYQK